MRHFDLSMKKRKQREIYTVADYCNFFRFFCMFEKTFVKNKKHNLVRLSCLHRCSSLHSIHCIYCRVFFFCSIHYQKVGITRKRKNKIHSCEEKRKKQTLSAYYVGMLFVYIIFVYMIFIYPLIFFSPISFK